MLKLIIEDDEGRKTVVPFAREEITIGRQEGNTIRLTERNVSRRHARLLRQNGHVLIEDLGSYNGIRVNGDRISGQVQVADGDLIQIGDYDLALQAEQVDTGPLGESGARATAAAKPAETRKLADPYGATATVPMLPAVSVPEPLSTPTPAPAPASDTEAGFGAPPEVPKSQSTAVIRIDQLEGAERKRPVVDIDPAEAPRLVVLTTDFAGKDFPCTRSELRIGRTDDNDIVIDHRSLSRTHCKLVREDSGEWRVIDMQSANGLMVNGESYAQVTLRRGDVLELGHVKLKFVGPDDDVVLPSASTSSVTLETASGGSRAPLIALVVSGLVIVLGIGGYAVWKSGQAVTPPTSTTAPGKGAEAPDGKAPLAQRLADARAAIAALDWPRAQQLLEGCQLDGSLHPEARAMLVQLDAEKGFKAALDDAAAALDAGDLDRAKTQLDAASETTLLKARHAELSSRRAEEVKKKLAVAPREPARKDPPAAADAPSEAAKQAEAEALLAEGIELNKSKRFEAAQKRLKRCIDLMPRYYPCFKQLGHAYASLWNRDRNVADQEQARLYYERFLELAPPDDPSISRVRKALSGATNK